ncbi:lactate oxidase [Streptococcus phocae subsp. salmonis]|uniref:lactate oxidase n=1 Tax=Streptococcus phocae TaxID=119224 RepID=UPI00068C94D6|nr:lactate oxidase [Streptococcus phocae]
MTITNGYKQSDREESLAILNLPSLEEKAKEIIPTGGFGYITEGSEYEWTLQENTKAFDHVQIIPRVLTSVSSPSTETTLLDIPLSMPIISAPTAAQGLAHARGELATAEGMAAAGTIMSQSTYGNATIADIAQAGQGAPQFFQLYMSKDWDINKAWLDEAVKSGVKAIVMTVDSMLGGYREADIVNNFQFPIPMGNLEKVAAGDSQGQGIAAIYAAAAQVILPEDVKKVADYTGLPVFVKGIQSPEDAEIAIQAGAAGIWVSNHGGRQLNGGPASFDVLRAIADKVNKRVPVVFDSGVRRGSHVFKALANGADIIAIGRPILYGLALGGAKGTQSVVEHLNKELKIVMQLAGTQTIEEIKQAPLIRQNPINDSLATKA